MICARVPTNYFGLDCGSFLWKAAVLNSEEAKPRFLELDEGVSPFLPLATEVSSKSDNQGQTIGWSALRKLCRAKRNVIVGLEGHEAAGAMAGSGSSVLQRLASQVEKIPGVKIIASTTNWPHRNPNTLLLNHMVRNGLRPNFLVPEWLAVIARRPTIRAQQALCVSLGSSECRATAIALVGDVWKCTGHVSNRQLSDANVRKQLLATIDRYTITMHRIDPQDQIDMDAEIHWQLAKILCGTSYRIGNSSRGIVIPCYKPSLMIRVHPTDIDQIIDGLASKLNQVVNSIAQYLPDPQMPTEIILWGGLSSFLPPKIAISATRLNCTNVRIESQGVVAKGLAALARNIAVSFDGTDGVEMIQIGQEPSEFTDREAQQDSLLIPCFTQLPKRWLSGGSPVSAWVDVLDGEQSLRLHLMQNRYLFGRSPHSDIVLRDHRVSKTHCEIFRQSSNFFVRDLNSRNGLLLNGQTIIEGILKSGDCVELGPGGPRLKFGRSSTDFSQSN